MRSTWGGGNRLSSYSNGFTLAEGTTCVATLEDNRFSAFTLAEVLVTLGIIGIVAALTMPSLINNSQNRELQSALNKNYSVISQALDLMKADIGGDINPASFKFNAFLSFWYWTKACDKIL